jgi:1L-myo-inositol 1-phosphate cytidylyltransferase / CDP-L-myo-inositol myo-inositolphosphotransferase
VLRALLYLPDATGERLAGALVSGRTLPVRAMVAAHRAGASRISMPATLHDAAVDRELRRMPALAAALHWLTPGAEAPADGPVRWLLLPASSLIHVSALEDLLAAPPGRPAVLAESADGSAPVALLSEPPPPTLWKDLAAGRAVGPEVVRWLRESGAVPRVATGPYVDGREEAGLARAEEALAATLSIAGDSGMDRYLHRQCSRWITRLLVRTALTPNQVSLMSLAVGLGAIWCFWAATPASAFGGVLLYALACIVDHADGELARLTFRESRLGASLDWTIDTIIHAGLVLAVGVTAGGPAMLPGMLIIGLLGAAGVTLSAVYARYLPHEIEIGPTVGGVLRNIANRDLFYLLLLGAATLRLLAPALVGAVAVVVAVGSQAYWMGCVARIRRLHRRRPA